MALNLDRRHLRIAGKCVGGHDADTRNYEPEELGRRWKKCHCPIRDAATFDMNRATPHPAGGANVFLRTHKTKGALFTWADDWLYERLLARVNDFETLRREFSELIVEPPAWPRGSARCRERRRTGSDETWRVKANRWSSLGFR